MSIFFFGNEQPAFDIAKRFVIGFEYSRKGDPQTQTERLTDGLESNLYRHPEVQGVPEEQIPENHRTQLPTRP